MLGLTTSRNRIIYVSLSSGLLLFLVLISSSGFGTRQREAGADNQAHPGTKFFPQLANPFRGNLFASWEFDAAPDGDDYGLSDRQCAAAFPKLYGDIDEMVSRRELNHVAKADFDSVEGDHVEKSIRAMIYRGELYVISDDGLAELQSRGLPHCMRYIALCWPTRTEINFRIASSEFTLATWQVMGRIVFGCTRNRLIRRRRTCG